MVLFCILVLEEKVLLPSLFFMELTGFLRVIYPFRQTILHSSYLYGVSNSSHAKLPLRHT